jgi:hypothetical protein
MTTSRNIPLIIMPPFIVVPVRLITVETMPKAVAFYHGVKPCRSGRDLGARPLALL